MVITKAMIIPRVIHGLLLYIELEKEKTYVRG